MKLNSILIEGCMVPIIAFRPGGFTKEDAYTFILSCDGVQIPVACKDKLADACRTYQLEGKRLRVVGRLARELGKHYVAAEHIEIMKE